MIYSKIRDLFNHLKLAGSGAEGQIQLTDAMNSLSKVQEMYSWTFRGKRYDIGTMKDWFKSHLELSIKSEFHTLLEDLITKQDSFDFGV